MTGTDRTVDSEEIAEEPGTRAQRHFWGLRVKLLTPLVHTRRPGVRVCAGVIRDWAWARSRASERRCRRAELTVLNYDRGPIERNPFVATPDPPVSAGSECRGRHRPRRGLNGGSLEERSWLPCCDEHGGPLRPRPSGKRISWEVSADGVSRVSSSAGQSGVSFPRGLLRRGGHQEPRCGKDEWSFPFFSF